MTKQAKLSVLTSKDNVSICFGEWFDKTYGNTYYDAEVTINGTTFCIPYKYGYNAGDSQSIDEALKAAGYRLRANNKDRHKPYRNVHTYTCKKLKRELFK